MTQPMTDRDRQIMALRSKSPKRADTGKPPAEQHNIDELALFRHVNEPAML